MRKWRYKTDESGRPRRFLSHRELSLWVALRVGNYAGPTLALCVLAAIFDPADLGRWSFLYLGVMILAACVLAISGIHLYVVLSGGLMSREERRRYLEGLRKSGR